MVFPARPSPFRGRAAELRRCRGLPLGPAPAAGAGGPGGGGKSTLAAALGHRLRARLSRRARVVPGGRWDHRTLLEMLAIRLGVPLGGFRDRARRLRALRRRLAGAATCSSSSTTTRTTARWRAFWRARRPPGRLAAHRAPLPALGRLGLSGGCAAGHAGPQPVPAGRRAHRAPALESARARHQQRAGRDGRRQRGRAARLAGRAAAWRACASIAHEDDLPELAPARPLGVAPLAAPADALLTVLAHLRGRSHRCALAARSLRAGRRRRRRRALASRRWHLVQQPLPGRFALHAIVRYAIEGRTRFDQRRARRPLRRLLERHPERLDLEQTHLFAAMDHAHTDLGPGPGPAPRSGCSSAWALS